ncbi:MAG: MBL fold metallo-hydrolase [Hyphomicrobiaceae bacterium]|nr:MBL fold metallo-hydrolase [Hyphomicrobiaceae bacterium]
MDDRKQALLTERRARRFSRRWLLRGLGLVGLGSGAFALTPARSNSYYDGPVSDHFDGVRFFNPGGNNPEGFGRFLKWQLTSRAEAWPATFAPQADMMPKLSAEIQGNVQVTAIGHASFLCQTGGCNILIDPVYAERASPVRFAGPKRVNAPGIAFEALPQIHAVIVTHNHYDHMDVGTLKRLWQRDNPRFITPLGNDTILRDEVGAIEVVALDWDQGMTVAYAANSGAAIEIIAVPTQHWSARGTRDRMHALWASFIVKNGSTTVYAVGDSGFGDGRTFQHVRTRHPKIQLALLPIGAYEPRWFMSTQHMNPAEAVAAFQLCGAERALGHHWGTFQLTNEAIDAPPKALALALQASGIAVDRFVPSWPGVKVQAGIMRIKDW